MKTPAAFLIFAALLGATRADASLPRAADGTGLSRPAPQLPAVASSEPSRFGFAEDLALLAPESTPGRFELFGPETRRFERTYARNNPLKYVDPDGKCSAPAMAKGQVGVCFEAFIMSKYVGGIGLGDNRWFSGTNGKLTPRIEVQFTVDTATGTTSAPMERVGQSDVLVSGLGRTGSAYTQMNTNYADESGTSITLGVTALNGLAFLPGAPKSTIDASVNFIVTPDGKVGIGPGSMLKLYPSAGAYAYKPGQENTPIILFERVEKTLEDLDRPMKAIEPVEPR